MNHPNIFLLLIMNVVQVTQGYIKHGVMSQESYCTGYYYNILQSKASQLTRRINIVIVLLHRNVKVSLLCSEKCHAIVC